MCRCEELKCEILLPKQKPKDFMHTPVGKTPPKPKTGWFNKMLDLLSAFHSGEDKVVEALITQWPVLVNRLVLLSSTIFLFFVFLNDPFQCVIMLLAGIRLTGIFDGGDVYRRAGCRQ